MKRGQGPPWKKVPEIKKTCEAAERAGVIVSLESEIFYKVVTVKNIEKDTTNGLIYAITIHFPTR